jgi:DNA-binding LacI/PurR family transcriptional regulator
MPTALVRQIESLLIDRLRELPDQHPLPTEPKLAKELGVSRRTVRKALASLERKEIVRRIGGKGNFPIRGHQALPIFQRRARLIGVVIGRSFNTFLREIARSTFDAAHKHGYNLVFATIDEEESFYRILDDPHVDGLFLYEVTDQKIIREISERKKPLCLVNHHSKIASVDSVQSDSQKAAFMAVRYLYQLGHRKIAFVDSDDPEFNPARRPGYEKAMKELKIFRKPEWIVETSSNIKGGEKAASYIFSLSSSKKPTAVIVFSTAAVIGLQKKLIKCGLRIPQDISVVSLGGHDINRKLHPSLPRLTRIASNNSRLGRRSIENLIERIQKPSSPRRNILTPVYLEEGESAGKI